VIPRADLDRALSDFGSLSQQLQVTAHPQGGFRLSLVQPGSFFARAGLRNDDIVRRVDGRPINGVDDAAAAYAWLRVTNHFTVDIVREGRPMTLRYVIAPAQPVTASAQ
jgi:S1-C subfamily serine protease